MRTKICLLAMIVLWSVSYSSAQDAKSVSIALIADKAGSLDKSPLMSLLEAQLSQNGNIKLLERAQIDKILQEQQLSAAGLLDRTNSIKIGQLLRADAFVIITAETSSQPTTPTSNAPTGTLIRVRVVQTSHGLRLLDCFEQLDQSKLKDVVQTISKRVTAVTDKLLLPAGQLIPVGIVDIHRVQLGDRYTMLERALPKLLSVRLGLEPKIVMLEREDLKILQDEKLRTQGEDSEFWASAVLIEGNLQPKDGDLIMSLCLRRPAGQATKSFTIPVEPNEPSVAIDKAATNIVQEILNAQPSSQWQLAAEAEQFYQQGQMLSNHLRFENAANLFETAHALQPQNVFYTWAIFINEWTSRTKNASFQYIDWRKISISTNRENRTPCLTDLELAELVSFLVRQIRDEFNKDKISAADIRNKFSRYLGSDGVGPAYFSNSVSIATEQIIKINRENRKIWIETLSNAIKKQLLINGYSITNDLSRAYLVWISSDDPNELINNLQKIFKEYVMPPELGGKFKSGSDRKYFYDRIFGSLSCFPLEYLNELIQVDDALINVESQKAIKLKLPKPLTQTASSSAKSELYQKIKFLLEELKNLGRSGNNQEKQQLLTQITNSIKGGGSRGSEENIIFIDFPVQVALWEEMCNLLIEQKDITNLAFLNPGWRPFNVRPNRAEPRIDIPSFLRYYVLLDRIAELLKSRTKDKQIFTALNNIKDYQTTIKTQFPELKIPQKKSNLSVKMLLTRKDWPQQINISVSYSGLQVTYKDRILWLAITSSTESGNTSLMGGRNWVTDFALAGINLQQKILDTFWQAKITSYNPVRTGNSSLSIGDDTSYVSRENVGILELPGSLSKGLKYFDSPKVFSTKNGLPSLLITSLTRDGDKLWIAYGGAGQESGLGLFDPLTGKWETVFCSTLKGDSPFSKGKPYVIHSMQKVSQDEIFFLVHDPTIPRDPSKENPEGLWKINRRTQELKYFGPVSTGNPEINMEYIGSKLQLNSPIYILKFDTNSEKITNIMGDISRLKSLYSQKNISVTFEKDLVVPESFSNAVTYGPFYDLGNINLSTSTIHNNKLWARMGASQILIAEKGKSYEEAQIIDNNLLDGQPVERFVSTPYGLIAIGKGTVGLIETE
jgi:hypothetical protein